MIATQTWFLFQFPQFSKNEFSMGGGGGGLNCVCCLLC